MAGKGDKNINNIQHKVMGKQIMPKAAHIQYMHQNVQTVGIILYDCMWHWTGWMMMQQKQQNLIHLRMWHAWKTKKSKWYNVPMIQENHMKKYDGFELFQFLMFWYVINIHAYVCAMILLCLKQILFTGLQPGRQPVSKSSKEKKLCVAKMLNRQVLQA